VGEVEAEEVEEVEEGGDKDDGGLREPSTDRRSVVVIGAFSRRAFSVVVATRRFVEKRPFMCP